MHEAGIEIILVTTLVNNLNNDQVGPIVNFARENPKKIAFVAVLTHATDPRSPVRTGLAETRD
jgi:uncharacterized radical SAM superfamily Fe-S cluster-containing enzyme